MLFSLIATNHPASVGRSSNENLSCSISLTEIVSPFWFSCPYRGYPTTFMKLCAIGLISYFSLISFQRIKLLLPSRKSFVRRFRSSLHWRLSSHYALFQFSVCADTIRLSWVSECLIIEDYFLEEIGGRGGGQVSWKMFLWWLKTKVGCSVVLNAPGRSLDGWWLDCASSRSLKLLCVGRVWHFLEQEIFGMNKWAEKGGMKKTGRKLRRRCKTC